MTDLTVLVSPNPLYPSTTGFSFGRKSPVSARPIMVTLEADIEPDPQQEADTKFGGEFSESSVSAPSRRSRTPRKYDSGLLSPPVNTWKSPRTRPRHRPTRSQSAPPERRSPTQEVPGVTEEVSSSPNTFAVRPPLRTATTFAAGASSSRGGELLRPPPPLLRPTTFWRKTRRSGVTGASYSPSTHLIRRSTYIAAGLAFDAPVHDLSALCVESRVGFIVVPSDQELL